MNSPDGCISNYTTLNEWFTSSKYPLFLGNALFEHSIHNSAHTLTQKDLGTSNALTLRRFFKFFRIRGLPRFLAWNPNTSRCLLSILRRDSNSFRLIYCGSVLSTFTECPNWFWIQAQVSSMYIYVLSCILLHF